jgi:hypothetical protein
MPESAFEAVNSGKLPDDKWQHWTQADTIAARTGLGSWNRKDIMAACTGHAPWLLRHAHWQHPTEHTLTHEQQCTMHAAAWTEHADNGR